MNSKLLPREKELQPWSTKLRNEATKEENHLWYDFLRTYTIRFNRQRIIGTYIVDFFCAKARLVVELDGGQHFEQAAMDYDELRTKYLASQGLEVLRFTNLEVNQNFAGVCTMIDRAVRERVGGL